MQTLTIYRDSAVAVATIKPDASSSQVKKIMGDNLLNITFEDNRNINFRLNDYCEVFGETYKIIQLPVVTKKSRFLYSYNLTLHAEGYDLTKAQFLFLGLDNSLRESDFSLMGNASDFLDLVIANANRVAPTFEKGVCINSIYKNLSFAKENCYNALSQIAEAFETEFWIIGKRLHLTKKINDTGETYKHGRNKGLYEITRNNLNNSNVVTRLYAYGSEKNLPPDYQNYSPRLRFPGGYNPCLISNLECTITDNLDGTSTYDFTWTAPLSAGVTAVQIEYRNIGLSDWTNETGSPTTPRSVTLPNTFGDYEFRFRTFGSTCYDTIPGTGVVTGIVPILTSTVTPLLVYTPLPFVERNVNLYGVIEHTEIFEDIYPHRTGIVTGVNAGDPQEFTDADIDFNVNDYLLPGLTAKVTFNTGQLAGYTFEVASFDNGTKKFLINKNGEERNLDIPSTLLRPAIGDEYVLIDIEMPTSYVTAAENELLTAANALLVQLSEPQLAYTIILDPAFVKRFNKSFNISDLIWIVDEELELQRKIRITTVTRNLLNEYEYQLELADIVTAGTIQRIINAQSSTERDVRDVNDQLQNNSILNNNVVGTLRFQNLPETNTDTGFSELRIEDSTGKLFKRI